MHTEITYYNKCSDSLDKCVTMLEDMGYNVALCGLHGSQNYGIDMPYSDTDFIAVVIPKFNDFAYKQSPVSKVIEGNKLFNGHVTVKDIRLIVEQWAKGSPNFIEVLFTKYIYINSNIPEMNEFIKHRERIAHCNEVNTLSALIGTINTKCEELTKPIESQKEDIEVHGYSAKCLAHILRLNDMITYYFKVPYAELLNPFISEKPEIIDFEDTIKDRQDRYNYLKDIRNYTADINADKAIVLAAAVNDHSFKLALSYPDTRNLKLDLAITTMMEQTTYNIIKNAVRIELNNDT